MQPKGEPTPFRVWRMSAYNIEIIGRRIKIGLFIN